MNHRELRFVPISNTHLYLYFQSKSKETVPVLNQCLVSVMDWIMLNKVKPNPDKIEVLLISQKADQAMEIQAVLLRVTV